jgi:acetate---CoA ligase (ADP-forming)
MSLLRSLLAPRSVAIVGASDDADKVGGRPVDYLRRFGFDGPVYPVNPHRRTVQNLMSYPDIDSLPEAPDAAVIVVPGEDAVAVVERCAARGVGAAVVMASGFAETSPDGRHAQARMAAAARSSGMRLMGPNCQGITNFAIGAALTFSTVYLEQPPQDGPIAVVSQSGSMSQVPYAMVRARGYGVRYCAATGNEADVSAGEVAAAVAGDPAVRLILLYLETVRDVTWLAELGRVAAGRKLPVVALKAGLTPAGQSAAASHTAALANEDRVVDAFLERAGIYRAVDLPDLVAAIDLHLQRDWEPAGRRVAVVSNSGASCVQAADAIVTSGLDLAPLGATTRARIERSLPSFATSRNPVDLTGALLTNNSLLGDVLVPLAQDPAVDSLIVALPILGQGYDIEALAAACADFGASGRPTIVIAINPAVEAVFRGVGLPVFATEVDAVAALAQWTAWHDRVTAAKTRPFVARSAADRGARPEAPDESEALDEMASMAVLRAAGVPVVDERFCADVEAAVRAFEATGGPVVVKGCSARIAHKSDLGLVEVDLRTEEDVRQAYERVATRLQSMDPQAPGILVAPMITGRRELMIGGRVDPVFGPVVVVGEGGSYVEVLPDNRVLLAPVEPGDVRAALERLRIAPVLRGVRGEPPADVDALAAAVVAVSRLLDDETGVVEVDINPVLVDAAGAGCLAVDALVRVAGSRVES